MMLSGVPDAGEFHMGKPAIFNSSPAKPMLLGLRQSFSSTAHEAGRQATSLLAATFEKKRKGRELRQSPAGRQTVAAVT